MVRLLYLKKWKSDVDHVILFQCNLGFSGSEDLLAEGFAGTNVIAIRLEALGDLTNSLDDALSRRRRQTDNETSSDSDDSTSASEESEAGNNSTETETEAPETTIPTTTTTTTTTQAVRIYVYSKVYTPTYLYVHSRPLT